MVQKSKKSLSQRVADDIYEMIVNEHTFQPGDKLPNENVLSEELGVSRATLREAIRSLVSQGVLEVHRGRGTFIVKDMRLFDDFGLDFIERVRIRLKDLYEMRLIFEPQVAALACERATDKELEYILEQGARVEKLILEGKDRTVADQEFHRAIVRASHNDFMIRLIPLINRAVSESIFLSINGETLAENTLRDHAVMMDFFRQRDSSGVQFAMLVHIHHAILTLNLNMEDEPILR